MYTVDAYYLQFVKDTDLLKAGCWGSLQLREAVGETAGCMNSVKNIHGKKRYTWIANIFGLNNLSLILSSVNFLKNFPLQVLPILYSKV